MDLISGRISAHKDGFGFVIPDEGQDDLYLSLRQMRSVTNGDRVLASVVGIDRRGPAGGWPVRLGTGGVTPVPHTVGGTASR